MKLLFVLTFKGSLEKWYNEGIANREMEVPFEYLRQNKFEKVQIFSYGVDDAKFLAKLNFEQDLKDRIELILPDRKLRSIIDFFKYSLALSKLKKAVRDGAVICKTNQINGAWTALLARLFCGCPLFLRCGYILSRRVIKNGQYLRAVPVFLLEFLCFNFASIVSVTTGDAKVYISHYVFRRSKIFVAPTYVNTEIFKAEVINKPVNRKVLFVGRLEHAKNIFNLIEGAKLADVELTVVGKGSLEKRMHDRASELGLVYTYHPSLMNEEIAELIRTHRYFLLPSIHEGLPKVLIEAMSGEMICVGSPTSGITDMIIPNKTGYLTKDFSAESIAETLKFAMQDEKAEEYGKNARQFVLDHHSIDAYVEREYSKIQSAL